MADENALIKQPKIISLLRNISKARFNCKYTDSKGKIGYLSYPPKKGFTPRQCEEIVSLEISGVETIDDKTDPKDDLRHLKHLKKLTLGEGVKTISRNSIPTSLSEIILAEGVSIPESFVSMGSITKVSAPGVTFDSQYANYNNTFFTDKFGRLHFTRSNHLSMGEIGVIDRSGKNLEDSAAALRKTSAESLLHHSSKHPNDKTLYVYARSISSGRNYSIHAVADTFPMPEEHKTELSDENLIGIMVNGVPEFDVTSLDLYPNLQTVYVGKSVDKVTGVRDPYNGGTDGRGHRQLLELSKAGKQQSIILLSENTVPITAPKAKSEEPVIEQTEQSITSDSRDIEL